jgi:type VI protein secretion system component VasF
MLYMVIEQFKDAPEIYRRFRGKGRMMPDGLAYISSWIDTDLKVCYQLMETEDPALFPRWTENWDDLMEFKIVPVRTSVEAAAIAERSQTG